MDLKTLLPYKAPELQGRVHVIGKEQFAIAGSTEKAMSGCPDIRKHTFLTVGARVQSLVSYNCTAQVAGGR